ncbi:MAG TPA: DMT family transporter [Burkholderiaceae bacterium]|nr:DMT family transporter [Burkholderiaceae bacterium]
MRITSRLALLLTLPPLLWAGNAVVGRMAVGHVPPLALNALRWVVATLMLLPLGWRVLASGRARADIAGRWRELALLGLLGVGAYNALQYLALTTSTPLNVTLIAASSPLWMMGVGATLYRVRPRPRDWLGSALSLAGVVVVLSRGSAAALARVHFVPGDLLMLLAVASWAFYSWQLARPPASMRGQARPDWNWAELLLVQTLFGGTFAVMFAGVEAELTDATIRWSPWVLLALLYVALGPSVIAYRCWGLGVAAVGPAVAAFFSNLTPLFAALLSAALLGAAPQPYHAVAFALIVAGIAVSARR